MSADDTEHEYDHDPGVTIEPLNDDYTSVEIYLKDDSIKSLRNGGGVTYELEDEDGEMVGVHVGAADSSGFGEYAFREYVESEYGEGTYQFDLLARSVRTSAFWKRVALYLVGFVSAPFVIMALGGSAAVAFVLGVLLMMTMPMIADSLGIPEPMEAAAHE